MRELTAQELEAVSGAGYLPHIGAAAVTYRTAYETATWYGADQLGSAIGNALYDFVNGS